MSVRWKISLLITLTGFAASLVFSVCFLNEMLEQPYRIMDSDLRAMAIQAVHIVDEQRQPGRLNAPLLIGDKRYWLKVRNRNTGNILYISELAKQVKLPEPAPGTGVTVSVDTSVAMAGLVRDGQKEVTFRVREEKISFHGRKFLVTVGRPMVKLEEELHDTYVGTIGGLFLSILLLSVSSYFVAGWILKPVKVINDQTREITERHLARRIPVQDGHYDEFNTLARTLNQVFNRLQHAFEQQNRFLADASHELKTPLTLIRLFVDEMRSASEEDPSYRQGEGMARMTEQVLRMERLVKNLLDLSSLEMDGRLVHERVDVGAMLASLAEEYRFLADRRDIRIKDALAPDMLVFGDEQRLIRAFSNIFDNAVKYNVDGGWIEITGKVMEHDIEITVTNSGPGVAESKIPKVFDRFYRVEESRSLRYGGSGLGLAIVKRIIELHGGTVRFTSRPEEWTRLSITLPQSQETAQA